MGFEWWQNSTCRRFLKQAVHVVNKPIQHYLVAIRPWKTRHPEYQLLFSDFSPVSTNIWVYAATKSLNVLLLTQNVVPWRWVVITHTRLYTAKSSSVQRTYSRYSHGDRGPDTAMIRHRQQPTRSCSGAVPPVWRSSLGVRRLRRRRVLQQQQQQPGWWLQWQTTSLPAAAAPWPLTAMSSWLRCVVLIDRRSVHCPSPLLRHQVVF